jgi:energy-converting hydrogenase Eha subunit G
MAEKVATETPVMKARSNPWMISTLVLGVLLIGFVAFTISGSGITGNVVGSSSVGLPISNSPNGGNSKTNYWEENKLIKHSNRLNPIQALF